MTAQTDTRDPLLEVTDLTTQFTTRRGTVTALDQVTFAIRPGELIALVGESGSGKSVTALSLMRLLDPGIGRVTGGRVLFEGTDLLGLSPARMRAVRGNRIAMVFQDPMTSLNPVMKVGAQIAESLLVHGQVGSRREARARAVELLDLVGIASPERRVGEYPYQMSGGMRQRVMIAIGLACSPKLLIADEPTTALDVTVQAGILELIQRLRHELDMAVLLITHDLGVVAGVADRVNVMYAGRIIESGPVAEIFHRHRHPYTQGLLASVPRMVGDTEALVPIPGMPPQLAQMPPGCPFAPRCDYAIGQCTESRPPLTEILPGHEVACWIRPERTEAAA
jgi:oligopeptide transport system ATP-binding protein